MDLGTRLVITHYGLGELQRRVRALAAIEQLLRVPVPDDSEADNGSMSRVWRDDLGALLGLVCDGLEEKADFAKQLARESWEQLRGCPMPGAED